MTSGGERLAIEGGLCFDSATLAAPTRADVLIEDGRITRVGADIDTFGAARQIDATGKLVIPGLINGHTHTRDNLAKGTSDVVTLELLRNLCPALVDGRTDEEQYVSAALGALEMLKSGCTGAYDLFGFTLEGNDAVVQAYLDVGLRAVLAPSMASRPFQLAVPGLFATLPHDVRNALDAIAFPSPEVVAQEVRRLFNWADGLAGGRIRIGVAPTVPVDCDDALLAICRSLAADLGVSVHTHLAETKVQALAAYRLWGESTVEHLARLGLLGPSFVGAHAIWLETAEIRLLADAGASTVYNPLSNLKLGSGVASVQDMLGMGLNVGLGTDGAMSSDSQDLFSAMRVGACLGRPAAPYQPENWLSLSQLWSMATTSGARILGMRDELGRIEAGYVADLTLLDLNTVFLQPFNDPLNCLGYCDTARCVDTVVVGGEVVLEAGRSTRVDESAIVARAHDLAQKYFPRRSTWRQLAAASDALVGSRCRELLIDQPGAPAPPEPVRS